MRIITRPPSAELRPDQKDQDSLPPYDVLDGILQRYMEEDQGLEDIVRAGFAAADVERVTRLIKITSTSGASRRWGFALPSRLWSRLAISHHLEVPRVDLRLFNPGAGHEADHRHRQTVQA